MVNATNGTVNRNPHKCIYNHGETVTLTAVPDTGYVFTGQSGNLSGSTNPVTIPMNTNKTITANFELAEQPVILRIPI